MKKFLISLLALSLMGNSYGTQSSQKTVRKAIERAGSTILDNIKNLKNLPKDTFTITNPKTEGLHLATNIIATGLHTTNTMINRYSKKNTWKNRFLLTNTLRIPLVENGTYLIIDLDQKNAGINFIATLASALEPISLYALWSLNHEAKIVIPFFKKYLNKFNNQLNELKTNQTPHPRVSEKKKLENDIKSIHKAIAHFNQRQEHTDHELNAHLGRTIMTHICKAIIDQQIIKRHQDHELCTNPDYTPTTYQHSNQLKIKNNEKSILEVCKHIASLMKNKDDKTQKILLENAWNLIHRLSGKNTNVIVNSIYNQIPQKNTRSQTYLKKNILDDRFLCTNPQMKQILKEVDKNLSNKFLGDFVGREDELKYNEPSFISKLFFEGKTTYAPAGLVHILKNNGVDKFNSLMEFIKNKSIKEQCKHILSEWANPKSFASDPTNKITEKKYGKRTTVFHYIFKNDEFYKLDKETQKQVIDTMIQNRMYIDANNQTPLDILKQKDKNLYTYASKHATEKFHNDFVGRVDELKITEDNKAVYGPAGLVHILKNNGIDYHKSLMNYLKKIPTLKKQCEYILELAMNKSLKSESTTIFHYVFSHKDFNELGEETKKALVKKMHETKLAEYQNNKDITPLDILEKKNKKLYNYAIDLEEQKMCEVD